MLALARYPPIVRCITFAACVLTAAACADTRPDQDLRIVEARAVERLSVALLWQDFQQQREAAERTYNGNAVIITGTATRAGTDDTGRPYVYFAQEATAGIHASLLAEAATDVITAVQDEDRVSLKCFCEGMGERDLLLESCILEP